MDLDACVLEPIVELLGLLIRLANDCVLFEAWSSTANFARCVVRPPGLFEAAEAPSLEVEARKFEYDIAPFAAVGSLD